LKDVMRDLHIQQPSLGLLAYPVLQAADILVVRGEIVPVGKDQASHLEVTREIARRFNEQFESVFPEPDTLIGEVGTLPGTDGEVKRRLAIGLNTFLESIRERRAKYRPSDVDEIIVGGSEKARVIAQETIDLARQAMRMNYYG